jgi:hypothetical protein
MRAALATALALLVACSRSAEPKTGGAEIPHPGPAASAAPEPHVDASVASPATPAIASAPTPPPETSWTDGAVVAELAKDCAYQPPDHDEMNPSELSCKSGLFGQSCVADPCFDEDQQDCKPSCEKACNGCAGQCITACKACKKPCKDDDCKRTCAVTCGQCRQACLTAKDRCSTGTCGQAYSACSKRLQAEWKNSGCRSGCAAYYTCFEDCTRSEHDSTPCIDRCRKPLLRVCPAPLARMCVLNGGGPTDVPP